MVQNVGQLERRRRGETEYMPCTDKKNQTIYIQEKDVKTVKTLKYLGSLFDANGGAEKGVNNRVKVICLILMMLQCGYSLLQCVMYHVNC